MACSTGGPPPHGCCRVLAEAPVNHCTAKGIRVSAILFLLFLGHSLFVRTSAFPGEPVRQWEKEETTHFTFYYYKKDRLLADYLIEGTEEEYAHIVGDIGMDPGLRAEVYLAPDRASFRRLQPPGEETEEWSVGVFYPHRNLILLLSTRVQEAAKTDLRQIMAHELTHFILFGITRGKGIRLPVWLHEGLALYEAREWDWGYRMIMAETALTRSFLPLASLEKGFPAEKRLAEQAYAQSISLIAYIINTYGTEYLHRLITHLIEGQTPAQAFYSIFGITLEGFEKNWHVYLRRRYNWIPFLTSGIALWFLISLLTLGIYLYKRRLARKRLVLWEIEDHIDSLFH